MTPKGNIVCIVLDGVGIGAAPDAAEYNDLGTNTLCNTAAAAGGLSLPHMAELGLGNIAKIQGVQHNENPSGAYGTMVEVSRGKDSTTGHWEIAGIQLTKDFPYYRNGFPAMLIDRFIALTGCKGVLGNTVASGTVIISELGEEHVRTGYPIVYTSADSVFQIAAHEEVIPLQRLYEMCEIARHKVCIGGDAVGRVIARPFVGTAGHFERTANRKDFSLLPPQATVLDLLQNAKIPTVGIGKIEDLFAGKGLSSSFHTKSNADGIDRTIEQMQRTKGGFLFINLVDFDQSFGHRQDPVGMKGALEYFDNRLPEIIEAMNEEDILMITADHGNDPTDNSTDHSREIVPLLVFSKKKKKGTAMGQRSSFADIGKTVADYFGVDGSQLAGNSFLRLVV